MDFAYIIIKLLSLTPNLYNFEFFYYKPLYTFNIVTCFFVHLTFQHLFINSLYLFVFGHPIETSIGSVHFFFFFLLCGILSIFFHIISDPSSNIPVVGASGAIAGIMGAHLIIIPKTSPHPIFSYFLTSFMVLLWFIDQLYHVIQPEGINGVSNIAWWAHIGGFVSGTILINFFYPKK